MGEPERDRRVTIAGAGQTLLESLELAPARVEAGWRRVGEALGAPSAELQRWASPNSQRYDQPERTPSSPPARSSQTAHPTTTTTTSTITTTLHRRCKFPLLGPARLGQGLHRLRRVRRRVGPARRGAGRGASGHLAHR